MRKEHQSVFAGKNFPDVDGRAFIPGGATGAMDEVLILHFVQQAGDPGNSEP